MAKNTKYVSEATNFINGFLKKHPEVIKEQKQLRHTWWDVDDIDLDEQQSYKECDDPVTGGYSYY